MSKILSNIEMHVSGARDFQAIVTTSKRTLQKFFVNSEALHCYSIVLFAYMERRKVFFIGRLIGSKVLFVN